MFRRTGMPKPSYFGRNFPIRRDKQAAGSSFRLQCCVRSAGVADCTRLLFQDYIILIISWPVMKPQASFAMGPGKGFPFSDEWKFITGLNTVFYIGSLVLSYRFYLELAQGKVNT